MWNIINLLILQSQFLMAIILQNLLKKDYIILKAITNIKIFEKIIKKQEHS